MKSRSDNPGHIPFPGEQNDEEIGTVNGNDSGRTEVPLSERDTEPNAGSLEKMVAEGDKFDSLMQMSRYLAHQLNNLLTTILANTQLASLMIENEEVKSYLSTVEAATSDAGTMVHKFQESVRALARPPE